MRRLGIAAAVGIVLLDATTLAQPRDRESVPDLLAGLEARQIALFEKLGPAVVFISTGAGFGSGFFVDEKGLILTNAHVVGNEQRAHVVRSNGQRLVAQVLKRAPANVDLVLLRVSGGPYPALALYPAAELAVGAWVASVGHGRGGIWSFNTGMVSNIYPHGNSRPVFQTQIPLNPGSSGGPVADRFGHVIGVVTAGLTNSNSINFAIRSSVALQSFPELAGSCECLRITAPAGVPIFVDERMVGVGPRVFQTVKPGDHEVFGVIRGVMRKLRVQYPRQRSVELK